MRHAILHISHACVSHRASLPEGEKSSLLETNPAEIGSTPPSRKNPKETLCNVMPRTDNAHREDHEDHKPQEKKKLFLAMHARKEKEIISLKNGDRAPVPKLT